ncbi:porin [Yokenella regensburgei]|jgi:outer membrane pore protein F|uniref:Outer membrane pore protein F n=1 Tax=Yokenella regensburgei TaxID=158877 RepID=A0AB38FRR7_9ENTR|nr:porin [Yokenella regensburgei]EHM47138.1 outer membrane protein [Yokenella regensburgei ATCC 43003]KFD19231.1 outer membrane protein F [Yokenella regensburgei ATCC 49455]MDQ4431617.1 porin [Yokenella regensburgei]RKR65171.1 outer membrane pore protein F [Yokenella regensburgei]SQA60163.1 Porin ompk36 [Yokenella regensburgei]
MMKRNILAAVIPALLVAGAANAAEIYNKSGNKLDFYGKAVGEHVWTTNGNTDSSDTTYVRIGFKGETQINDQLTGYGQWEYNLDASNAEGSQGTKTRLGFAGIKAGDYGSFDYGRNYGAIYDVESATDMLVEWGGDGWNYTDNYMTGRTNGVATYRNSDFFGLVDGLRFALQYQGKNDSTSRDVVKQNGDGFSSSVSYDIGEGFGVSAGYANSNRTVAQKADGAGDKAEAFATSAKYDANNLYAAVMYSQTYNMTPENDKTFANKTQNFEAVVQYQFDFGLRPSIGYVQTKGKDLAARTANGSTFSGGDADLTKYVEVGTWYYFNKNMNVYAAYKFNLLNDNDYSKATGLATDDQAAVGIVYQF